MLNKLIRRFAADESGTAYIMGAFAMLPLLGMTGLAVDYTNAVRIETQVNTAAQSVALHLAKRTTLNPNIPAEDLVREGKGLMAAMVKGHTLSYDRFEVDPTDGMVQIVAKTDVETYMMHLFGQDELTVYGRKQAQFGRRIIEVAIAIDNSGSMNRWSAGKRMIDAAKDAANVLIDSASDAVDDFANSDLKFAVIPWTNKVAVPDRYLGGSARNAWWIDWDGKSTGHFRYLPPYRDGGDMYFPMPRRDHRWPEETNDEFAFYDPNRLTDYLPLEDDGNGVDLDELRALPEINIITRKDVFDNLRDVDWNGCFDHRYGDYRFSFDAPNNWDGDSLWVPHMAPDEFDYSRRDDNSLRWYRNSYLDDLGGDTDYRRNDDHDEGHLTVHRRYNHFSRDDIHRALTFNTPKYAVSGSIGWSTNAHGYRKSPNGLCNISKMIGLTDDRDDVEDAIDDMSASGGTDLTSGLVWAMNALTPWEPLDAALPFGEAEKIMVFMTDGENSPTLAGYQYAMNNSNVGYYNDDPWGLGWPNDVSEPGHVNPQLDIATKRYCDEIKARGVKVYYIYFGNPSTAATELMEHCATNSNTAIAARDSDELEAAFRKIGDDIGKLRLTHYTPDED